MVVASLAAPAILGGAVAVAHLDILYRNSNGGRLSLNIVRPVGLGWGEMRRSLGREEVRREGERRG